MSGEGRLDVLNLMSKSYMDFSLHGNMDKKHKDWSNDPMPTKRHVPSKDEKPDERIIEFLTEDFRDTAVHLFGLTQIDLQ